MFRVRRHSSAANSVCRIPPRYAKPLQRAQTGTPFRTGVFEPFVQDVEQARAVQPMTVEALRSSPLGASVDMLLTQRSGGVTALVTLSAVNDVATLREFAQKSGDNVRLLDIKDASEELVAAQRTRMLVDSGGGCGTARRGRRVRAAQSLARVSRARSDGCSRRYSCSRSCA